MLRSIGKQSGESVMSVFITFLSSFARTCSVGLPSYLSIWLAWKLARFACSKVMGWPLPRKIKWILQEKSAATAAMNYWQVCEGCAFFAIRSFHVVFVCAPQWSDVVGIGRPVTPMPTATTHPSRFAADASRVSMATEESASVSYHPCWFHHRERKLPNNTINDTKIFFMLIL